MKPLKAYQKLVLKKKGKVLDLEDILKKNSVRKGKLSTKDLIRRRKDEEDEEEEHAPTRGGTYQIDKVPKLNEVMDYLDKNLKKKDSLSKRIQTYKDLVSIVEAGYSFSEKITNFNEDIREIEMNGSPSKLHVLYPQSDKLQEDFGMKTNFYAGTDKEAVMDIFEDYVRSGAKSAFDAFSKIGKRLRQKNPLKGNIYESLKHFPNVTHADIIRYKKVSNPGDMLASNVYLVPNKALSKWTGMAYLDDAVAVYLNIRGVVMDKVFSNPKKNHAMVAAHEFVHARFENMDRFFEAEHATRVVDFLSTPEKYFAWEFVTHPYSKMTEILDIAGIYFEPGIKEIGYESLVQEDENIDLWNKNMISNDGLMKKISNMRSSIVELMFDTEVDYSSIDGHALDALVSLTGMENFPLWLKACQEYTCIAMPPEERLKFEKNYGFGLKGLVDDVKETYFEWVTESMEEGPDFFRLEYSIRDMYFDCINEIYPEFTQKQRDVAWEIFMQQFIKPDPSRGANMFKIDYGQIEIGHVKHSIESRAAVTEQMLQYMTNIIHSDEAKEVWLDRMQVFDYLHQRLSLATDLSNIQSEMHYMNEEFDASHRVRKYDSKILNPDVNLFKMFNVYGSSETANQIYTDEFHEEMGKRKTKIKKLAQMDFKTGKERHLKLKMYLNSKEQTDFVEVFRGADNKGKVRFDPKASAIIFEHNGGTHLDTIVYSSNPYKEKAGYYEFDRAEKIDGLMEYLPFGLLYDDKYKDYETRGKDLVEKVDAYLKEE